jgi:iron complex outermembrane receptor protein
VDAGDTPLAYTLNVSRLRYGGYRAFSDATNAYLASTVALGDAHGGLRLAVHAADYDARNPGSLSDSLLRVDRRQAFAPNVAQRTGETGRHGELGLAGHRLLGGGELRASVYGVARSLDNPIPNRVIDLSRRAGGARVAYATPLARGDSPARLLVGTELQTQRDDRRNFVNAAGQRGALALDQLERVTALAGFAQLAADITGRIGVVGALRYDRTRFTVHDRLVSPTNPDDSGERALPAWSPSLGVTYAVTSAATLYANVATAFETPTTTELANRPSGAGGFNPALDPQRTRSVEVGGNARLGGRATVQLAAYRAALRDAPVAFEVPSAPGRQFFRNAAAARHQGVEAGATIALARGAALRAAYTFTDARFRDYTVGSQSFAGNRVPGIAPHRADAVLTYARPAGAFAELETRYVSTVPVNDANGAGTASPAATIVNVRVGTPPRPVGTVRVGAFAGMANALDRPYNASVVINAFGRRYYEPGPGRAVYAGLELAVGGVGAGR